MDVTPTKRTSGHGGPEQPPRDFGIRIATDGCWYYHGSPIQRLPLVRLFASVLRREEDGRYWLVTPAERGTIAVDDVPFIAIAMQARGTGRDQILTFTTNLDDKVVAGESHPLRVAIDPETAEPRPYVLVRPGLEARLTRSVFFDLVDLGREERLEGGTVYGIWSDGQFFPLGNPGTRA